MSSCVKKGIVIDGCENINDIILRYKKLDVIFENIKKDKRIKTMNNFFSYNFREWGGILIHIGPNEKLFFGKGGYHRFAIAHILNIPFPAQIGCVHISSISYLNKLRKKIKQK